VAERLIFVAIGALIILASRKLKNGADLGSAAMWLTLAAVAFSYAESTIEKDAASGIFYLVVGCGLSIGAVRPGLRIARRFLGLFKSRN
jgi:hypothetical protein